MQNDSLKPHKRKSQRPDSGIIRRSSLPPAAMTVPSSVLYSGFRFSHHNPGSGYDACVPTGHAYVCGNTLPWSDHPESSWKRHVNFLLVDLATLARGLTAETVHYLYPENTAYLSPWPLRLLGKRIVYTLHLSEDEWLGPVPSMFMRLKQLSLRATHAIVALSREQQAVYAEHFPDKLIEFVPHGIDFDTRVELSAELFARRLQRPSLVVVGHNYRNFDLLERIIESRGHRMVTFHLIGMDTATRQRFAGKPGVICHPHLEQEAYEQLLRGALAMLLPLSFATANNAILEAYKACLPVLATRIPGVTDYAVDGDEGLFDSPNELWSKFDALLRLDSTRLRERSLGLRRRARERFSWNTVRGLLTQLY
ncbi:MAG: glycosyltransferase family 4 protein [Polyangiales bacterium]